MLMAKKWAGRGMLPWPPLRFHCQPMYCVLSVAYTYYIAGNHQHLWLCTETSCITIIWFQGGLPSLSIIVTRVASDSGFWLPFRKSLACYLQARFWKNFSFTLKQKVFEIASYLFCQIWWTLLAMHVCTAKLTRLAWYQIGLSQLQIDDYNIIIFAL